MSAYAQKYQAQLEEYLNRPGKISDSLALVEQKTQVKRTYIVYGAVAVATLWLMFGYGAQLLCNLIGFVYPAYCSIKALESPQKSDDTQWLMYWVVFSLFSLLEFFSDILVGWVPFYYLTKCAFLVWCMSPMEGSTIIYNKAILPFFRKHESAIDEVVRKGQDKIAKFAEGAVEKAKDIAAEQQLKKSD